MQDGLTIKEVSLATGVTTHTLRYYERIGVLPRVTRTTSRHRRYSPDDVRWVQFMRKLQSTGMPIRAMLEYARLRRQGERTFAERRGLLEEHKRNVEARLAELEENLDVIRKKIAKYHELEKAAKSAAKSSGRARPSTEHRSLT